jgi:uncharacterized protein
LLNDIFKVFLVGRNANWNVVLRFALPGAVAAFAGAFLLTVFNDMPALYTYSLGMRTCAITPIKLCIGLLIAGFSILDFIPWFNRLEFSSRYLPLGGMLSGFFGGLSGHQGALRSAFLIKSGLSKEAYVGTSVMSAMIVDLARLTVYGAAFFARFDVLKHDARYLIIAASLAAFAGAFTGKKLLHKMTVSAVRTLVAICLLLLSIALIAGII